MFKLHISLLFLALLSLLLTACSAAPRHSPTPLPTQPLTHTQAASPTLKPAPAASATHLSSPTHSQVPATPTSTLTPRATKTATRTPSPTTTSTATFPPEARLTIQCLHMAQNLPQNANLSGTMVLAESITGPVHFWNMGTGDKTTPVPDENEIINDFTVSPDGKWLAYTLTPSVAKMETSQLVIYSYNDPRQTKTITLPIEWSISRWLDNERIILRKSLEPITTLVVLNPFINQQMELAPDFPNLYSLYPSPDYENQSITIYDPSLGRVVYLSNDGLILMDTQSHQKLAEILPIPLFEAAPKWSPDGQQFVIANMMDDPNFVAHELYSVTRDGQINQLTHLAAYYGRTNISTYSWSPDGRFIALWLVTNPQDPVDTYHANLAVLDMNSKDVVNYCLPGTSKNYRDLPPVWSPNSQQLVMEVADKDVARKKNVMVVDIAQGWAAQIGENLTPIGWMAGP